MKRSIALVVLTLASVTACTASPGGFPGTVVSLPGKSTGFALQSVRNAERFLVKTKTATDKKRLVEILGKSVKGEISPLAILLVEGQSLASLQTALDHSALLGGIEYVEPDGTAYAFACTEEPTPITLPQDYFYQQPATAGLWGLKKIRAGVDYPTNTVCPETTAWHFTTGTESIRVAVIDTGIAATHLDLSGQVVESQTFVSGTTTGDDDNGHGTHVAGTIAALNGGGQVVGLAPTTKLMAVKVLNSSGSGNWSSIASGIVWATDHGANVINLSLGGMISSATLRDAVNYAWNKGVVIAAAAGNNGSSAKSYPAAYDVCLAVAATDDADRKASFSSYGAKWVDVAAPGVGIWSTYLADSYRQLSGTSMATPHVSALAALLWSHLGLTTGKVESAKIIRDRIEQQADPISGTGRYWSKGRINAYRSLSI
ncbi:MAG: peptidase S8 [Cyanobacteria bacterium NC_groundwater_1444_Ag_S-0.65um_54_12]|nr:peptidase S8 [Cyanobacteria bacterium NC_groundwater_1444_Ag_S-0.65um_54_12]